MKIFAVVLVLLASLVAVGNAGGCIQAYLRRRRGEQGGFSTLPLMSLVCCLAAWLLAGDDLGAWLLAPAILDPANWSLVALPFFLLGRSGQPVSTPRVPSGWNLRLSRVRRLLIEELARSAAHHEAGRYSELGEAFGQVEDLLRTFDPQDLLRQTPEYLACQLLDAWIDASNHGWLHHEPVLQEDWPELARRMQEVLEGRRKFRPGEFPGILP